MNEFELYGEAADKNAMMYEFLRGMGLLLEGMALAKRTPENEKKLASVMRKAADCIEKCDVDQETTDQALALVNEVEANQDDCIDCDQYPCTGCTREW
jgi:hypothetical protein